MFFASTYNVTFSESGLPSGTSWSVTLNGSTEFSTTSTIVFTVINGSYAFNVSAVTGYTVQPSSGRAVVTGAAVPEAVTFMLIVGATYSVSFTETGLVPGTTWSVTLGGALESSTTATIVFTEPNGTYSYSVTSVAGYQVSPASGNVDVSGAPASQGISFTTTAPGNVHGDLRRNRIAFGHLLVGHVQRNAAKLLKRVDRVQRTERILRIQRGRCERLQCFSRFGKRYDSGAELERGGHLYGQLRREFGPLRGPDHPRVDHSHRRHPGGHRGHRGRADDAAAIAPEGRTSPAQTTVIGLSPLFAFGRPHKTDRSPPEGVAGPRRGEPVIPSPRRPGDPAKPTRVSR